jgi:hypothetical protein
MTSLREIELRLGEEAVEGARQKEEGKRKVGIKNGGRKASLRPEARREARQEEEGFIGVIGNSQVGGGSS